MHCPNCGAQASSDQKFCRAWGLGLGKVAQILAEELSGRAPEENLTQFRTRLNKLDRLWHVALAGFLTSFVGLIIWGIIDAIIIKKGHSARKNQARPFPPLNHQIDA